MGRPNPGERGYGYRWRKARTGFLSRHPMCAFPGCQLPGTHVHHKIPHRGDMGLFWDRRNWEPRCTEHHNRDGSQQDRHGYSNRVGADGLPIDPAHPFNRAEADE